MQQVLGRSNDHHRSLHHTPTGASAARRHTRQAPDTYDRTAINRATEEAYVPHMYVYSSRRTQGLRYGSCRGATVGPRTVGRPIPPERASHARVDQRVEADDPSGLLPPAICRALAEHASPPIRASTPTALAPPCTACWPAVGCASDCRAASAGPTGVGQDEVEVGHRRRPLYSYLFGTSGRRGPRLRPLPLQSRRCEMPCVASLHQL